MWWSEALTASGRRRTASRRRLLSGLSAGPGLLLLGACGFRPLYAGSGAGSEAGAEGKMVAAELAAIQVEAPLTRLGRILQNQLIDDLDPAGLSIPHRYRLDLDLRQSRRALAIQLDDTITRFDLTLAAFFTLRELSEAVPVRRDGDHVIDRAADTGLTLPDLLDLEADDRLADMPVDDEAAGADTGADAGVGSGAASPDLLYRSAVRRVASYNVISDPFATLIAEQDAQRRAAVEVSRQIRTLLTIYFENAAA